jgi:hypothetical protein
LTLAVFKLLKKGENTIEIAVTNQWTNRLIGDERHPDNSGYEYGNDTYSKDAKYDMPDWYVKNQLQPETKRYTFTTADFYKANDALVSSGLLGPVALRFFKVVFKE